MTGAEIGVASHRREREPALLNGIPQPSARLAVEIQGGHVRPFGDEHHALIPKLDRLV